MVKKAYKNLGYVLASLAIVLLGVNIAANIISRDVAIDVNAFRPDVIVIDPGHGGLDGGATNGGIVEKDINLAISLKLADLYKAAGYTVIMTREEDCSTVEGKFNKKQDIRKRLSIIENAGDVLAISIHQNQFTSSKAKGAQVYYGKNNPASKEVADKLGDGVTMLSEGSKRVVKPITKDVYLVHTSTKPIILVECGFLSNPSERALLQDEDYQKLIAFWIFSSTYR